MKRQKKPADSKSKPVKRESSHPAKSSASKAETATGVAAETPKTSPPPPKGSADIPVRKSSPTEITAPSAPTQKSPSTPIALSTSTTPPPPKRRAKSRPQRQPLKPKQPPVNIPPILLEGDLPPSPKLAGPGARYTLAASAPQTPAPPENQPTGNALTELPESYGTQRLFLAARDPRWLYASWDLALEQQRAYNQRSRDGHLILRVYAGDETSTVVPDVHVNPESRNFFINVPRPETRYWAELGYYTRTGGWVQITKSQNTFTPPDAPAPEAAAEFATIPVEVSFEQVVKTVQNFVTEHQPLLEAVIAAQEAQKQETLASPSASAPSPETHSTEPAPNSPPAWHTKSISAERGTQRKPGESLDPPATIHPEPPRRTRRARPEIPIRIERAQPWTPERRATLARLINIDSYRRVWMGSIEITELVRRQLQEELASVAAAELARFAAEAGGPGAPLVNISSPLGGEAPQHGRRFWFKVNAELIVYGATEPDAQVTIAERPVKLRPDGTFSFRFALPDGRYGLPATATSADGVESREAALEFSRSTDYRGHVEAHPQDAGLRSPRPENL